MNRYSQLFFIGIILLIGCFDQGLDPNNVTEPGFGGSISYISRKPPSDSLRDLRIVAIPYFPIDTLFQPIILKVIEGTIPFSDDIRSTADSGRTIPYQFFVKPHVYYYVAIVQQFGIDVFSHWRVVSVYGVTPTDSLPKAIVVEDGKFSHDINFVVDFYHLPPQPFKVP